MSCSLCFSRFSPTDMRAGQHHSLPDRRTGASSPFIYTVSVKVSRDTVRLFPVVGRSERSCAWFPEHRIVPLREVGPGLASPAAQTKSVAPASRHPHYWQTGSWQAGSPLGVPTPERGHDSSTEGTPAFLKRQKKVTLTAAIAIICEIDSRLSDSSDI